MPSDINQETVAATLQRMAGRDGGAGGAARTALIATRPAAWPGPRVGVTWASVARTGTVSRSLQEIDDARRRLAEDVREEQIPSSALSAVSRMAASPRRSAVDMQVGDADAKA